MIRSSVLKTAGFKIDDVSAIKFAGEPGTLLPDETPRDERASPLADSCYIPALFVAGEHDDFVAPHHSKQIYKLYAGDKNLVLVEGDHNSARP